MVAVISQNNKTIAFLVEEFQEHNLITKRQRRNFYWLSKVSNSYKEYCLDTK